MEKVLVVPLARTVKVARRLDVSPKTVRRLVARGKLRALRVGQLMRFEEREVERFLAAARRKPKRTRRAKRA